MVYPACYWKWPSGNSGFSHEHRMVIFHRFLSTFTRGYITYDVPIILFTIFFSKSVHMFFSRMFPCFPMFSHIVSMVFLWFSHGFPMKNGDFPRFPHIIPLFRMMTLDCCWRLPDLPGPAGAVEWSRSRRGNASGMWARDHPRRGRVDQKSGDAGDWNLLM